MSKTLHFPLLISGPKEVPITEEEHSNLSIIGIASFMITYPITIGVNNKPGRCRIYMSQSKSYLYMDNRRFDGMDKWTNGSVEMDMVDVPLDHPTFDLLKRKFSHLFFKGTPGIND